MKKYLLVFILLFIQQIIPLQSQYIGKIFIDRRDVFDSTQSDWFFAAKFANSLHATTKQFLIEDELLFNEADEVDEELINETERNLRSTGLFSMVKVTLKPLKNGDYDVDVLTQDKWSLQPYVLYEFGGKEYHLGAGALELNLFGTGFQINGQGYYRSENSIGWQGMLELQQRRLFRTPFSFYGMLQANKIRTDRQINISKNYLTLEDKNSYGISLLNSYGSFISYPNDTTTLLMPYKQLKGTLFYSLAWKSEDRVFLTLLGQADKVNRGKPEYAQAYDNSARLLIGFSSVADKYVPVEKVNTFMTEDLSIGGWGTAILGKTFALDSTGQSLFYVAAQGEKSVLFENLYLFGQATGASAFTHTRGYYTYEEFLGLGFYKFSPDMIVGARLRQQTVWNWFAVRQLILDNNFGLRGYRLNQLSGDNRIVANLEFRTFSDISLWIFRLSGALFYDIGSVWNQSTPLFNTRWHSAAGFGIRFHNMKASTDREVLRFDFAYNFDERRFAEIIFSSSQLFSFFSPHTFKLPELYGMEFDGQ